ncbi:MAG: transcriptional regulator, partial [Pseudonocardiales bacterium]|nr:transcriptional regulator [Pseudonocardiales bacterium]
MKAEGFTRLTYELHEEWGVTRLTVRHDASGAPGVAAMVAGRGDDTSAGAGGGGWPWILSDLKSLLETGTAFTRATPA